MDIDDQILRRMARLEPLCVPISKIGRCLALLDGEDREKLRASISKRRPKTDEDRLELLQLALRERAGGILFVDRLGGFEGQRPC